MAPEFRLLGPVEIGASGRAVDVGELRRRAVLAALLVDADRVVPKATLIDRVWGEAPPEHAAKTLGTHITRIRRVLESATAGSVPAGSAAVMRVLNRDGGYLVSIDGDWVDLQRFRQTDG
jgi:DNA-binding SARP family transcriptional activator